MPDLKRALILLALCAAATLSCMNSCSAADLRLARTLLDSLGAPGLLAGGGSAFWPVLGEGRALTEDTLRAAGDVLDIVTWHYYPQQSHRCPLATRRAERRRTASPARLGEVDRWARQVEDQARAHAPRAAVWLGETASAQCGGEPGISNTFADALWWLDELGRLARRGEQVVIRQTLSGSDYGLVDDATLEPNPSYWAAWLWRRTSGAARSLCRCANTDAAIRCGTFTGAVGPRRASPS